MNTHNSGSSNVGTMIRHDASCMAWCKTKFLDSIKTLIEGWSAVLKLRPNNGRLFLILLIIAFEFEIFTEEQWSQYFLYMRLKLQYTMEDFTQLMLIAGIIGLVGQYFFLPLFVRKLKFHDATIALIGRFIDIF